MKTTALLISPLLLLALITLPNMSAKSVYTSKRLETTYAKSSNVKSESDAYEYLEKYGYSPCDNQLESAKKERTKVLCQSNMESMLQNFQTMYRLPVTGKVDRKTLEIMSMPRCGVKDKPLSRFSFKLGKSWSKKSFTWRLTNGNLPKYGAIKTREQIQQSFDYWAKYAPLTFREGPANEKADFDLAFIDKEQDKFNLFDGPNGTLAYASEPSSGVIRYEAEEKWTDKYDGSGINFIIVTAHEIGHALGLQHSVDPSALMYGIYKLMKPDKLLQKDDSAGIQAMYGIKHPPKKVTPTVTRRTPKTTTKRPTEPEKAIVLYGTPHGGKGGGPFDDAIDLKLSPMQSCVGVEVFWWSSQLFAIRFIYEENNPSAQKVYRGDPTSRTPPLFNHTFMMRIGEKINKVTWYAGTHLWLYDNKWIFYVLGIQFHTTAGRVSPLYGSKQGQEFTESHEGFTLGYVKGRSGLLVDMLQFVWQNQVQVNAPEFQYFAASCAGSTKSSKLLILSAIYQSKSNHSSCSIDATHVVRKLCSMKSVCSFAVTTEVLRHDPCHGALKELQVTYTCSTHRHVFGAVLSNIDSSGNDIHLNGRENIENVESIELCGKYCLAEKRCVGVVYAPKDRLCWLKHTMVARNTAHNRDLMVVVNHDRYL